MDYTYVMPKKDLHSSPIYQAATGQYSDLFSLVIYFGGQCCHIFKWILSTNYEVNIVPKLGYRETG